MSAQASGNGADREARRTAAMILEVLAGLRSAGEASEALGLALVRYYVLERRAVSGMVDAMGPRPRGRPRSDEERARQLTGEVERLQGEVARLESLHRARSGRSACRRSPRAGPGRGAVAASRPADGPSRGRGGCWRGCASRILPPGGDSCGVLLGARSRRWVGNRWGSTWSSAWRTAAGQGASDGGAGEPDGLARRSRSWRRSAAWAARASTSCATGPVRCAGGALEGLPVRVPGSVMPGKRSCGRCRSRTRSCACSWSPSVCAPSWPW